MNDMTNTQETTPANPAFESTITIVSAFLSGTNVPIQPDQISDMISNTYGTLSGLIGQTVTEASPEAKEPAVDPKRSVKRDHLICLEDGKKVKMLKRYLMTNYGLTPDDYRQKWGLPSDYPMVAPEYSERRRKLAQEIGLGKKGRAARKATTDAKNTSKRSTSKKAGEKANA